MTVRDESFEMHNAGIHVFKLGLPRASNQKEKAVLPHRRMQQ